MKSTHNLSIHSIKYGLRIGTDRVLFRDGNKDNDNNNWFTKVDTVEYTKTGIGTLTSS